MTRSPVVAERDRPRVHSSSAAQRGAAILSLLVVWALVGGWSSPVAAAPPATPAPATAPTAAPSTAPTAATPPTSSARKARLANDPHAVLHKARVQKLMATTYGLKALCEGDPTPAPAAATQMNVAPPAPAKAPKGRPDKGPPPPPPALSTPQEKTNEADKQRAKAQEKVNEADKQRAKAHIEALQKAAGPKAAPLVREHQVFAVGADSEPSQVATFRNEVCAFFDAKPDFDVRAFTDPVAANAAVLADWGSVSRVLDWVAQKPAVKTAARISALQSQLKSEMRAQADKQVKIAADVPPLPPAARAAGLVATAVTSEIPGIAGPGPAIPGLGGLDLGAAAANVLETSLTALARLIADRAKREGIGWFLDRVGQDVCGQDEGIQPATVKALLAQLPPLTPADDKETPEIKAQKNAQRNARAAISAWLESPAGSRASQKGWLSSLLDGIQEPVDPTAKKALADVKAQLANLEAARTADQKGIVQYELRTYWFPALCSLAGSRTQYMVQYGGGGKLLEGLRGALSSDVRGWPGAASGLGLAAAFWGALSNDYKTNGHVLGLFECTADTKVPAACQSVLKLRQAGAAFVGEIASGQSGTNAMFALSGAIDSANRQPAPAAPAPPAAPAETKFYVEGLQMAACAASLPYVFDTSGDMLPTVETHKTDTTKKDSSQPTADATKTDPPQPAVDTPSPNLDRAQKAEALLVAGLASSPACWAIVGKGAKVKECLAFGGTKDACGLFSAVDPRNNGAALEHLSTVLRLSGRFSSGAKTVESQWAKLVASLEGFENAVQGLQNAGADKAKTQTPDLSKLTDGKTASDALKALQDYVASEAQRVQNGPVLKVLQAALGLAQAGLDFGVTGLGAVEGVLDKDLYPGLVEFDPTKVVAELDRGKLTLQAISKDVGTLRGIFTDDWASTLTAAAGALRVHVDDACSGTDRCGDVLPALSKHVGLIVLVLTEKDPDRIAEGLDAVAMPPGGWRTKVQPGTFVVTIASFPGFAGGFEFRNGQYGVFKERFANGVYANAPTLTLPVGVDFTWGFKRTSGAAGLFISAIDPAAFLQYDPSNAARLPGPRLTTVLAPGLWARFVPGQSPFSINPYFVYRPGLRAWQASVNGPAADALQFGLALSVDVTLLELHSNRSTP